MEKFEYQFTIAGPGGKAIAKTVHSNDNPVDAMLSAMIGFVDSEEFKAVCSAEKGAISVRIETIKIPLGDNDGTALAAFAG